MPIRREQRCGYAGVALGLALGTTGCAVDTASATDGVDSVGVESAALRLAPSRALDENTRFYAPPPKSGAIKQVFELARHRKYADALRVSAMATTPQAVWFNGGTPQQVRSDVKKTMAAAASTQAVPTLVAYDIPFRDCAQYSAGGAKNTAEYQAWIDGFAAGIGKGKAVIILEPDSLGIIPYNTTISGSQDWCKPTVTDADGNTLPAPGVVRRALRPAPVRHRQDPGARTERFGLHRRLAQRVARGERGGFPLVQGGLQRRRAARAGFYLNVSNFQPTAELTQFGTWVSMCLAADTPGVGPDRMRDATTGAPHFDWCPGQYDPATNYTQVNYTPEFAATVTAGIEGLMDGASAQVKFVLDTSRNGQGPWTPPPSASYPDPQVWCNPPDRGLGHRPTVATGNPLVAANLWIKTPGDSDGSCNRGVAGVTTDPEWSNTVDPAAGEWFPGLALDLAKLATPPVF